MYEVARWEIPSDHYSWEIPSLQQLITYVTMKLSTDSPVGHALITKEAAYPEKEWWNPNLKNYKKINLA